MRVHLDLLTPIMCTRLSDNASLEWISSHSGKSTLHLGTVGVSGAICAALRAGEAMGVLGGAGGVMWMTGGASLAARGWRGACSCLSGTS